jgi:hypothetical protein
VARRDLDAVDDMPPRYAVYERCARSQAIRHQLPRRSAIKTTCDFLFFGAEDETP